MTASHMTDTSPRRWHAQSNPALRDTIDTIDAHQRRVSGLCCSLAAFMGHPLTGSELPWAARHHDEAERVLGDMPAPAKARFPMLAEQYEIAERAILAEMGLSWTLTPKEQQILHLCDKLDAYTWARKHGARGPDWDAAHVMLMVMADKFNAREWVLAEMANRVPAQEADVTEKAEAMRAEAIERHEASVIARQTARIKADATRAALKPKYQPTQKRKLIPGKDR